MTAKTKRIIILLSVVAVVICGAVAVLLFLPDEGSADMYMEKLAKAQNYVAEENYEYAIKYYKEAIELNPDDETAYRELGNIYVLMGNYDLAVAAFRQGYERTLSNRLKSLVTKYLPYTEEGGNTAVSLGEEGTLQQTNTVTDKNSSGALAINTALLNSFTENTFVYYVRDYGSASYDKSGDVCLVTHERFGGQFKYANNTEYSDDLDPSGYPLDNAKPDEVTLTDISPLFSSWDGSPISYDALERIGVIGLRRVNTEGRSAVQFNYSGCTVQIELNEAGAIAARNVWNKIVIAQQYREESGEKKPYVVDIILATTGMHAEGEYNVQIAKTEDVISGDSSVMGIGDNLIYDISTTNGVIDIELENGEYTVCVYPTSNPGLSRRYKWNVDENTVDSDLKIIVTEQISEGQIIIVLKWGDSPRDIDAHLKGEGKHIYYNHRRDGDINLDVDCTNGNGIETITIEDTTGDYLYYVVNYSREEPMGERSGATVEVFTGGSSFPQVFVMPTDIVNDWDVFSISNGVVTPINTESGNHDRWD